MKLLTATLKDESKSCMPKRYFCEGPIKCINWISTSDFQLNQNVSSWSPWRFSASGCQRQDQLLSNSTFDVRHHYLSKSWRLFNLAFRIWPNLALRMATLSKLRISPLETFIALEPQVLQMSHASLKDHKSKQGLLEQYKTSPLKRNPKGTF